MNADERGWNQITERIIGCAFKVANTLGCGFLEKVYHNALAYELRKAGMNVAEFHPIPVLYDGVVVGDYEADLLVEDTILIELKAVRALEDVHSAQCINYVKATGRPICLLFNFGKTRVRIKRFVQLRPTEEVTES